MENALASAEGERRELTEALPVRVGLWQGLGEREREGGAVAVPPAPLPLAVGHRVAGAVGVGRGEALGQAVAESVGVRLGEREGTAVTEALPAALLLAVWLPVAVPAPPLLLLQPEAVAVEVRVGLALGLALPQAVPVAVLQGLAEALEVRVAVPVPPDTVPLPHPPQPAGLPVPPPSPLLPLGETLPQREPEAAGEALTPLLPLAASGAGLGLPVALPPLALPLGAALEALERGEAVAPGEALLLPLLLLNRAGVGERLGAEGEALS